MNYRTNAYNSVLIVDDMPSVRNIVRTILRSTGVKHILEAADGRQALQQLEHAQRVASPEFCYNSDFSRLTKYRPVDLIVLDWNMPKMNGIEFLSTIKNISELKDIPVIMLTAESEIEKIREVATFGVAGYIVKPFRTCVLEDRIQSVFNEAAA